MSELLDLVGQHLDRNWVVAISRSLGTDPKLTEQAIGAAMPTLLGAVTQNAADPSGQRSLHRALISDHDGSIFDNLGVLLGEQPAAAETSGISARTLAGGAILDHILGARRQRVEDAVSRASGLTPAQTMKLMSILAPLLMGALGKRRQEGNLSTEGVGEMLRRERADVDSGTFSGGVISRLFDQDGDGDFDFMDIMKFGASRIFGRG